MRMPELWRVLVQGKMIQQRVTANRRFRSRDTVFSARYEPQGTKGLPIVMKKALPKFKTEDAEREFWAQHDSGEFIDWRKGKRVMLPNLRPSSQTISLRLPRPMLDRLKVLANKRDVPYQSLLKMWQRG